MVDDDYISDEIRKNQTQTNVFFLRKSPPNQGFV